MRKRGAVMELRSWGALVVTEWTPLHQARELVVILYNGVWCGVDIKQERAEHLCNHSTYSWFVHHLLVLLTVSLTCEDRMEDSFWTTSSVRWIQVSLYG
uniref:Uncharacterized protein n=1 Tax=Lates calcarifer TaxID=8187 RepID=A0A4W6D7N9_LATCA